MAILKDAIELIFIAITMCYVVQSVHLDQIAFGQTGSIIMQVFNATPVTAANIRQTPGVFIIGKVNKLPTECPVSQTALNTDQTMGISVQTRFCRINGIG